MKAQYSSLIGSPAKEIIGSANVDLELKTRHTGCGDYGNKKKAQGVRY